MLSFLEDRARDMGYSALWLETGKVNLRAVSFYKGRGYHRIESYGGYVGREKSVCMWTSSTSA